MCDVGYAPAGGSRYRKCVDGKWTALHLRCERMDLALSSCVFDISGMMR